MRTSDIIMSQSDNNITLDFSAFSSMQENDYLELNVNNISIYDLFQLNLKRLGIKFFIQKNKKYCKKSTEKIKKIST